VVRVVVGRIVPEAGDYAGAGRVDRKGFAWMSAVMGAYSRMKKETMMGVERGRIVPETGDYASTSRRETVLGWSDPSAALVFAVGEAVAHGV